MDKFQAAFEILYLLSLVDGEVSQPEINIINNFINDNYSSVSFDGSAIIQSINMLTSEGMLEELRTAVLTFKNYSSAMERNNLLRFALELVLADGYLTEGERGLLYVIANTFNVDLNQFLSQYQ